MPDPIDASLDRIVAEQSRSAALSAQMLERIHGLAEEADERRRNRPVRPLDDAVLELIDRLTADPDAPPGYHALRRRVDSGATTWELVWHDAHAAGTAALRLKLDVAGRLLAGPEARQALANLQAVDHALRTDPDGVRREVEEEQRRRAAAGEDVPPVLPGVFADPSGGDDEPDDGPAAPRSRRRPPPGGDGYGAGSR